MHLRIQNLTTCFDGPRGQVPVVDDVSLDIPAGRTLALVGESGCGKTLTALSILGLLPPRGRITGGRIVFGDLDLRTLGPRQLRGIRGGQIAMIFQEPMSCLNPLLTVGRQIEEVLELHRRLRGRAALTEVTELLRRVRLPEPERARRAYPHQLSGGMRQRVMLAMALAGRPRLLIADEPTTALDATVQTQVLRLLRDLREQQRMSMLFITHNLDIVPHVADRVCIMYAGRIVEAGSVERVFTTPGHPYTRGLLASLPRRARGRRQPLPVIPGDVPAAGQRPPGCAFHPRCNLGRNDPLCRSRTPPRLEVSAGRSCACWQAAGYPRQDALERVGGRGATPYNCDP